MSVRRQPDFHNNYVYNPQHGKTGGPKQRHDRYTQSQPMEGRFFVAEATLELAGHGH